MPRSDTDQLITDADEILQAGLHAVDPYNLIREQITRADDTLKFSAGLTIDLREYSRVFVCGTGKGTAPMARAMEELLGDKLTGGDIIVKYDHIDQLRTIRLHEAAHPVPDENTLRATREMLGNLGQLRQTDLVFVLLTGGGSALMEDLPEHVSLDDLQTLSRILLESGANIHEINCVRKHISRIKGGQLARYLMPARQITLALSDVIGDDLSVIASGPTSPDPSTFDEAWSIIRKYDVAERLPAPVRDHLLKGSEGKIQETPKPGERLFDKVTNLVIGSNRLALSTSELKARQLGYQTLILSSAIEGEAKELARFIGAIMKETWQADQPVDKPACILLGGEPTVRIRGKGKGGRNQELCLALALSQPDFPFVFISCGSDGTDGPTDAAGARVTHETLRRAEALGLDGVQLLKNNDSYHFFKPLGDLIMTGPTRTNVMDLIFALIPVTKS